MTYKGRGKLRKNLEWEMKKSCGSVANIEFMEFLTDLTDLIVTYENEPLDNEGVENLLIEGKKIKITIQFF